MLTSKGERDTFLKMFVQSGRSKSDLKFAFSFQGSLQHQDVTAVSCNEDYFNATQILSMNGRQLSEFKDVKEAMKDVDYLVQRNMKENGWTEEDHPHQLDKTKPEYSKFWFVKSGGKTTTWQQVQEKKLVGDGDVKDVAQLKDGFQFMEGLGWEEESATTITNVKYDEMAKGLEGTVRQFRKPIARGKGCLAQWVLSVRILCLASPNCRHAEFDFEKWIGDHF